MIVLWVLAAGAGFLGLLVVLLVMSSTRLNHRAEGGQ